MNRRQMIAAAAAAASAAWPFAHSQRAAAQLAGNAFIVSGFPAGGMGDLLSRPLSEKLRGSYAANVLVDNRVGAGGRLAAEYVKRANPDGLTILQIPASIMTLYPHIYKSLNYDPLLDFVPVSALCTYVYSFTASAALPAEIRTVADFVTWARANPKQSSYGIPAAGSALHLRRHDAPARDRHGVHRRALSRRRAAAHRHAGRRHPGELQRAGRSAAACAQRQAALPRREQRADDRRSCRTCRHSSSRASRTSRCRNGWAGFFRRARRMDVVQKLNLGVRDGLQSPEMVASLANSGLQPRYTTPEEFARLVKQDYDRWGADRESHRLHRRGLSGMFRMKLTGAQALVRVLAAEQVAFRVRHRRRQARAAAACDRARAGHPLRRRAARGRRPDDGGGGLSPAPAAWRWRSARWGPGGLNLAVRRRRRLQQQSRRAADHHQPASRRRLSARRHVHGPGHARRVQAADQVERGRARPAPHAGARAPRVSRGARAAGPGRFTSTFRRTCWPRSATSPTTSSTCRRDAIAPSTVRARRRRRSPPRPSCCGRRAGR